MTEPANNADGPARGDRKSTGSRGEPSATPCPRRSVSILPWAAAEPSRPDVPRASRPADRAAPVPPSGLIAAGGFTERSAVSESSPWLPATQRSGPPPTSRLQPWSPARSTYPGPRPVPEPPPPRPPRPERGFASPPSWTRSGLLPSPGPSRRGPVALPGPVPSPGPSRRGPVASPGPGPRPAPATPARSTASALSTPPGRAAPTADALRHEWIVTQEREVPTLGWRAGLYAATGGLVNLGVGPAERAGLELTKRVRQPLAGSHQIAVTSIKGGIGKTTVAACLGLTLAEYRGDGVIALDADPDAGTLADRLSGPPTSGVRGLLDELENLNSLSTFSRHTSLAGRLRVLASEQDPATGESFSGEEYERICAVLTRFFDIVITDSGTGLVHSAMQGTLRVADRLVVVGAPTVDGASRASKTLDWLLAHGHGELAEEAVLVLCQDRSSHKVDREAIRDHFAQRCRYVVEVPADPHLSAGGVIDPSRLAPATRDAYLELAALVADGYRSR